jgi:hypothetical protein
MANDLIVSAGQLFFSEKVDSAQIMKACEPMLKQAAASKTDQLYAIKTLHNKKREKAIS